MELTDLVEKLQDTQSEISNVKTIIAQDSDVPPSMLFMLRGFEKRQEELELSYAQATNERYIDVMSYRLFNDNDAPPTVPALASALSCFQTLYTVVYDALNKVKKTSRVTADAVAATTFRYGYTFAGSVGFVLTLPNERLLLDETDLDKAIQTVFEMAQATSSDQVAAFAKRLGPAPIREMYKWAEALVDGGLGADIDWRRENDVRAHLLLQLPELRNLQDVIIETGDDVVKTRSLSGTLVGIDVVRHTFHMTFGQSAEMRGRLSESIGKVEVPAQYTAQIQTTTKINYATENEATSHLLIALKLST